MSDQAAVDLLNRLLGAEHESLLLRLGEAEPFVNLPGAEDGARVQQMLADAKAHQRDLVRGILDLRGAPVPPRYDTATGNLHYLGLAHLMPEVIESLRRLVNVYESVGATGNAEADAVIARNLQDYQRHLAALEKIHSNLVDPPRPNERCEASEIKVPAVSPT